MNLKLSSNLITFIIPGADGSTTVLISECVAGEQAWWRQVVHRQYSTSYITGLFIYLTRYITFYNNIFHVTVTCQNRCPSFLVFCSRYSIHSFLQVLLCQWLSLFCISGFSFAVVAVHAGGKCWRLASFTLIPGLFQDN